MRRDRRRGLRLRSTDSAAPTRAACTPHASGSRPPWRGRNMGPYADMPSNDSLTRATGLVKRAVRATREAGLGKRPHPTPWRGGGGVLHASRVPLYEFRIAHRVILMGVAFVSLIAITVPARADDPLNTVRAFCQADGRGARVDPLSWPAVADLVTW